MDPGILQFSTSVATILAAIVALLWLIVAGVKAFRNRVRIKIYDLKRHGFSKGSAPNPGIIFEAMNKGTNPTVIHREIKMVGYYPPRKFEKCEYSLVILGDDRTLGHMIPKKFTAFFEIPSDQMNKLDLQWYISYRFSFEKGRSLKVRLLNASGQRLNFFSYYFDLLRYKSSGSKSSNQVK